MRISDPRDGFGNPLLTAVSVSGGLQGCGTEEDPLLFRGLSVRGADGSLVSDGVLSLKAVDGMGFSLGEGGEVLVSCGESLHGRAIELLDVAPELTDGNSGRVFMWTGADSDTLKRGTVYAMLPDGGQAMSLGAGGRLEALPSPLFSFVEIGQLGAGGISRKELEEHDLSSAAHRALFDAKADRSELDGKVGTAEFGEYVASAGDLIASKADTLAMDEKLSSKLETSVFESHSSSVSDALALKADASVVESGLAGKQDAITAERPLSAASVSGLSKVAMTGAYGDLSGVPDIPAVNDALVTVNQGGVLKKSFTLNQSEPVVIDLDAIAGGSAVSPQVQADWSVSDSSSKAFILNKPVNVSEFSNDAGYQTGAEVGSAISSAVTGLAAKAEVDGALALKADASALGDYALAAEVSSSLAGKADSAEVDSKLGLKADASALQAEVSALESGLAGKQNAITSDHQLDYGMISGVPSKLGDFSNDAGYQTGAEVGSAISSAVTGLATREELAGKADVSDMEEWNGIVGDLLAGKADAAEVNDALLLKADKTELAGLQTAEQVSAMIADRVASVVRFRGVKGSVSELDALLESADSPAQVGDLWLVGVSGSGDSFEEHVCVEDAGVRRFELIGSVDPDAFSRLSEELGAKADKSEVSGALDLKADKASLSSYALAVDVTSSLGLKADGTYVDEKLGEKADKAELDDKAGVAWVNERLALKPDKTALDDYALAVDVTSSLAGKADVTYVDGALALKADANAVSDMVSMEQLNEGLSGKQDAITSDHKLDYGMISGAPSKLSDFSNDTEYQTGAEVGSAVSSAVSGLATKDEVSSKADAIALEAKADKSHVDARLALKADVSAVESGLAGKQDVITVDHPLPAASVSGLSNVAMTGAYGDLSGAPDIPEVNDAEVVIREGGQVRGRFTLNQKSGATIDLEGGSSSGELNQVQANWKETDAMSPGFIQNKPADVGDFSNDAGYQTAAEVGSAVSSAVTGLVTKEELGLKADKAKVDELLAGKADVSTLGDYALASDVTSSLSAKADRAELDDYVKGSVLDGKLAGTASVTHVDSRLALKADKTALSDYALAADVTSSLALKADKAELDDKAGVAWVNERLALKPDKTALSDYALAADVTSSLDDKADRAVLDDYALAADVTSSLSLKSDKTYVDGKLALKAETSHVDEQLGLKADKTALSDYALAAEVTSSLALKADKTYVDEKLTDKADKKSLSDYALVANVASSLALKADKTYVDEKLADKADKAHVDERLALKADKTALDGYALVADVTSSLALKADAKHVESQLAGKVGVSDFEQYKSSAAALVGGKADQSELDSFRESVGASLDLKLEADAIAGFVTGSEVDSLIGSKLVQAVRFKGVKGSVSELDALLESADSPAQAGDLWLVRNGVSGGGNLFDEYVCMAERGAEGTETKRFELFGSVSPDALSSMSGKLDEVGVSLAGKADAAVVTSSLALKADRSELDGYVKGSVLDGKLADVASVKYVDGKLGVKADVSAVDSALAKKQDKITSDHQLDYGLISGVPVNVSQFSNDAGYQTGAEVGSAVLSAVSGLATKAELAGKADAGDLLKYVKEPDGISPSQVGLLHRNSDGTYSLISQEEGSSGIRFDQKTIVSSADGTYGVGKIPVSSVSGMDAVLSSKADKSYVEEQISALDGKVVSMVRFKGVRNSVDELEQLIGSPDSPAQVGDLWLIRNIEQDGGNLFEEYVCVEDSRGTDPAMRFELVGSVDSSALSDLSSRLAAAEASLGEKVDKSAMLQLLGLKQDKIDSSHKISHEFVEGLVNANNATVTVNQGGVLKKSFTLNQSEPVVIDLDAGGAGGVDQVQADWDETTSSSKAFILNKPVNVSQFSNDAKYQTAVEVGSAITSAVSGLATKEEVDGALALKADASYVNEQLGLKADKTALDDYALAANVTSSLALKSDITYVDGKLADKADLTALELKADTSYVNEQLGLKADKTALDDYVTSSVFEERMKLKADITYVDGKLADKADKKYVDDELLLIRNSIGDIGAALDQINGEVL